MANMTIENIGGMVRDGNVERIMDHSTKIESPVAPEIPNLDGQAGAASAGGRSFADMINDSMNKVNELQLQADQGVKELIAGRNKNIHETMLMMEKADMSFKLMMQVRNKIIDAYREVMRMQV
jgi:flagellar hook-basal body complex protein FliE